MKENSNNKQLDLEVLQLDLEVELKLLPWNLPQDLEILDVNQPRKAVGYLRKLLLM